MLDEKEGGVFDHDFIKEKVAGYPKLLQDLVQFEEQELLNHLQIDSQLIEETAQLLARTIK